MKKGYTLIELLVTIFCATLILVSLTSSVIFISKTCSKVVDNSQINYKLSYIRDYIVKNEEKIITDNNINANNLKFSYENDELKVTYSENDWIVLATNIKIGQILFYKTEGNDFVKCDINYYRESVLCKYSFIVKEIS